MTLQDWGALGEMIGGVAIIVSLIYVGIQIRQGTKASRSATSQAFTEQYTNIMIQLPLNPDLHGLFLRGLDGFEDLQADEKARLISYMMTIFKTWESFYIQSKEGNLDPEMFEAWMQQLIDLYVAPGTQEFWELRKHQFTPSYRTYLESQSLERETRPLYGGKDA